MGYPSSWIWGRPLADVKRFRRGAWGPQGSRWQRVVSKIGVLVVQGHSICKQWAETGRRKKWRKVPPGPVLLQRSRGGGLIQRIFQRDIFAGTNVCCSRKKSFLSSYLPPPLPSLTSFLRSNINAVKCINYFLAWQKFKYVYTCITTTQVKV